MIAVLLGAAVVPAALRAEVNSVEKGDGAPSDAAKKDSKKKELAKATLGSGCFWCGEAIYEQLEGVESARIGEDLFGCLHVGRVDQLVRAVPDHGLQTVAGILDVALQTDDTVAQHESLVAAGLALRDVDGPTRDLEGVAVPVKGQ